MKLGLSKTDYPFDYFFAKATTERTAAKEECADNAHCDDSDDAVLSSDSDDELNVMSEVVSCSDSVRHSSADVEVTE